MKIIIFFLISLLKIYTNQCTSQKKLETKLSKFLIGNKIDPTNDLGQKYIINENQVIGELTTTSTPIYYRISKKMKKL